MVERQLRARGIEDERVLEAMERVPRELFVPDELRARAYDDAALPIGAEQTISQPYMVARICAELQLRGGEKVLDVGTGSGYQAAVLAELGARGALARADSGARRPRTSGARRGGLRATASTCTTATAPSACPARRRSAASPSRPPPGEPPPALLEQLEPRGRLVIPIGPPHQQFLRVYVQTPEGAADFAAVPCRFVPLVTRRLTFAQRPLRLDSMAAWGPSPLRRRSVSRCSLHGIQLGRPTDLLARRRVVACARLRRALRRRVACASSRGRRRSRRATEIAVGSALMLLEDVAFYAKRSISFRSLLGGELPARRRACATC